jgi:hypothetical protein
MRDRELSRALASRHWPTGEAVILSAAVHERRGSRGRTLFEPVVQFRYNLQGADALGYRLAFGDVTARSRPDAEQVASRFSPGSIWSVSICERRPELSVIHAGPTRSIWFAVCFFAGYAALSVAFVIDAYRRL